MAAGKDGDVTGGAGKVLVHQQELGIGIHVYPSKGSLHLGWI